MLLGVALRQLALEGEAGNAEEDEESRSRLEDWLERCGGSRAIAAGSVPKEFRGQYRGDRG